MAWNAYTSDVLMDMGSVSCGPNCTMSVRLAYRLYCDMTNTTNPLIRIEVTYLHVRLTLSETTGTLYWNSSALGLFLGSYPGTFDQAQFELNEQRDESGNYVNEFSWPYVYEVQGTYSGTGQTSSLNEAVTDVNSVMWGSSPVVGAALFSSVHSFEGTEYDYGLNTSDFSNEVQVGLWGKCFADMSKYTGTNANGQSKVYVTSSTLDIATSSTKLSSTGDNLSYSSELSTDVSELEVASPYTGDECFAYVEISVSDLKSRGLVKYDPSYFEGDGVSSPYVVDAFVVPFSLWTRTRGTSGYAKLSRDPASEKEVTLGYEEIDVPEYDPPEPIGPVDDNTVFRLVRQYNTDGTLVVDQNGRPVLAWIKCERLGQE